jgi:hypothetical protein
VVTRACEKYGINCTVVRLEAVFDIGDVDLE